MTIVESARRDWADGHRRFVADGRDPAAARTLHLQLEVLTDELRRRVGGTFTLEDLARVYAASEAWARAAVGERAATHRWALALSVAIDEAFHSYSTGALDYTP